MAAEDDDWRSDIFDAEGNYLQQDSTYKFPEELSRGSARQRLNMQHGFMRHIEHNQLARQQYEAQNPSNTMQQRYLAKPSEPQSWRRSFDDLSPSQQAQYRAELDESSRYMPPHMRSGLSPDQPAKSSYSSVSSHVAIPVAATQRGFGQARPQLQIGEVASSSSPPPGFVRVGPVRNDAPADVLQAQGLTRIEEEQLPSTPATLSIVMDQDLLTPLASDTDATAEEKRRQRKFREGFAAYTAPPLLGRRPVQSPAMGPAPLSQLAEEQLQAGIVTAHSSSQPRQHATAAQAQSRVSMQNGGLTEGQALHHAAPTPPLASLQAMASSSNGPPGFTMPASRTTIPDAVSLPPGFALNNAVNHGHEQSSAPPATALGMQAETSARPLRYVPIPLPVTADNNRSSQSRGAAKSTPRSAASVAQSSPAAQQNSADRPPGFAASASQASSMEKELPPGFGPSTSATTASKSDPAVKSSKAMPGGSAAKAPDSSHAVKGSQALQQAKAAASRSLAAQATDQKGVPSSKLQPQQSAVHSGQTASVSIGNELPPGFQAVTKPQTSVPKGRDTLSRASLVNAALYAANTVGPEASNTPPGFSAGPLQPKQKSSLSNDAATRQASLQLDDLPPGFLAKSTSAMATNRSAKANGGMSSDTHLPKSQKSAAEGRRLKRNGEQSQATARFETASQGSGDLPPGFSVQSNHQQAVRPSPSLQQAIKQKGVSQHQLQQNQQQQQHSDSQQRPPGLQAPAQQAQQQRQSTSEDERPPGFKASAQQAQQQKKVSDEDEQVPGLNASTQQAQQQKHSSGVDQRPSGFKRSAQQVQQQKQSTSEDDQPPGFKTSAQQAHQHWQSSGVGDEPPGVMPLAQQAQQRKQPFEDDKAHGLKAAAEQAQQQQQSFSEDDRPPGFVCSAQQAQHATEQQSAIPPKPVPAAKQNRGRQPKPQQSDGPPGFTLVPRLDLSQTNISRAVLEPSDSPPGYGASVAQDEQARSAQQVAPIQNAVAVPSSSSGPDALYKSMLRQAPTGAMPSRPRPNVQDLRQSVYDAYTCPRPSASTLPDPAQAHGHDIPHQADAVSAAWIDDSRATSSAFHTGQAADRVNPHAWRDERLQSDYMLSPGRSAHSQTTSSVSCEHPHDAHSHEPPSQSQPPWRHHHHDQAQPIQEAGRHQEQVWGAQQPSHAPSNQQADYAQQNFWQQQGNLSAAVPSRLERFPLKPTHAVNGVHGTTGSSAHSSVQHPHCSYPDTQSSSMQSRQANSWDVNGSHDPADLPHTCFQTGAGAAVSDQQLIAQDGWGTDSPLARGQAPHAFSQQQPHVLKQQHASSSMSHSAACTQEVATNVSLQHAGQQYSQAYPDDAGYGRSSRLGHDGHYRQHQGSHASNHTHQFRQRAESAQHRGGYQSGGQASEADEEAPSCMSTPRHPPQKLSEVVGLLSWVVPRPTPAQKLRQVGWDEEHRPELSLQHLRELSRHEKKGYGWSTDEEPSSSRAVLARNASEDSEMQLWRPGKASFLFRKTSQPRPGPVAAGWE